MLLALLLLPLPWLVAPNKNNNQVHAMIRHGARGPYTKPRCWEGYDMRWDCNITEVVISCEKREHTSHLRVYLLACLLALAQTSEVKTRKKRTPDRRPETAVRPEPEINSCRLSTFVFFSFQPDVPVGLHRAVATEAEREPTCSERPEA